MKPCSFDARSKSQPGRTHKGGEYLHGSVFSEWEGVREAPVILRARGTPTMKGLEGHPRWSCAPGPRALRRASLDGRA